MYRLYGESIQLQVPSGNMPTIREPQLLKPLTGFPLVSAQLHKIAFGGPQICCGEKRGKNHAICPEEFLKDRCLGHFCGWTFQNHNLQLLNPKLQVHPWDSRFLLAKIQLLAQSRFWLVQHRFDTNSQVDSGTTMQQIPCASRTSLQYLSVTSNTHWPSRFQDVVPQKRANHSIRLVLLGTNHN